MARSDRKWSFYGPVGFFVDWFSSARCIFYSFFHRFVTEVAAAGSTQGTATLLSGGGVHKVTTAAAGSGVILTGNAVISGLLMDVRNNGANAVNVYPATGHKIIQADGTDLGTNNPYSLAVNGWVKLITWDASGTVWQEIP